MHVFIYLYTTHIINHYFTPRYKNAKHEFTCQLILSVTSEYTLEKITMKVYLKRSFVICMGNSLMKGEE